MPRIRIGVSAWTDPDLTGTFYPPDIRAAEERLRFYAAHFDTVEVDSTYYALPAERNAHLWAKRTPEDFLFHIKAFALLTQHPAETSRLPKALREALPPKDQERDRLHHPPSPILELAFQMFGSALLPLKEAKKLGVLLFQFPPWFQAKKENYDYILYCQEKLPGYRLAIEFRHPSWLAGQKRQQTLTFLQNHQMVYVCVDEPLSPLTVPPLCLATTSEAYIRFHGRNFVGWFAKGASVKEKFRYRYSREELLPWVSKVHKLHGVETVTLIFNNCFADYAIQNARMMRELFAQIDPHPQAIQS